MPLSPEPRSLSGLRKYNQDSPPFALSIMTSSQRTQSVSAAVSKARYEIYNIKWLIVLSTPNAVRCLLSTFSIQMTAGAHFVLPIFCLVASCLRITLPASMRATPSAKGFTTGLGIRPEVRVKAVQTVKLQTHPTDSECWKWVNSGHGIDKQEENGILIVPKLG
jgi:hypothetical protein